MKRFLGTSLLITLLAGCSTPPPAAPSQPATAASSHAPIGMANPASVSCIKKGGKLDIRKDAAGNEDGVCVFPDGKECQEWPLFRDNQCIAPPKP
ncbi:DUF333 domain-containing protein [Dyella tabacisoli]|uniref:DUF333 domain-containing protein n=1 Tax=Dyella tabacisoli TaxID=2282381 RepID=A0A369UPW9_9GAMM|nr:DUF333 domain-containing protein [Dyella tabacisoli]RDD82581.1 DUF333 domain-containing protein [Dyella tabacisoli]